MREKKFVYNLNNAKIIYNAIKSAGINFVIYVPETWTREILKLLLQDKDIEAVNATGEAEAMAIAAGASLGGKTPMVLMEGLRIRDEHLRTLSAGTNASHELVDYVEPCGGTGRVGILPLGHSANCGAVTIHSSYPALYHSKNRRS